MGEWRFPNWDPVFLDLWGPLDLRYYGLMYVVAFVCGQYILGRLARSGFLPMPPEKVGDLIFYLIFGVILGGRLGYCLFYKPEILHEPLQLFKVWEGGLAFHGGLLGVVVAFILYSRKHGLPGWRLCDALALATCPGILAVRIANFINGELYGRIIRPGDWQPPWAMRFPTDTVARVPLARAAGLDSAKLDAMGKRDWELLVLHSYTDDTNGNGISNWNEIKDAVPLRHPSQLYEGLTEGLVLGLVLWLAYRSSRRRPFGTGVYGGIFLIGYGLMRFAVEYFRQPDEHFSKDEQGLGTILFGLSMGQLLCTGMLICGTLLLLFRRGKGLTGGVTGG
ncbi:MAG: prolipoprotein diacylglyceryl transferase [Planctomycetes bacterium]|nr:prolipoprotein diacylglyceryl transferase [Planctomycetota bacterium]